MGTSSISIDTPLDKHAYTIDKDSKTTTMSHGFRVTAYVVKDKTGNVVE
jgi:hypothetical protein